MLLRFHQNLRLDVLIKKCSYKKKKSVCPTKLSNAPGRVTIEDNTVTAPTRTGGTTNQNTELPGSGATNQSPADPKKIDNT